MKLFATKGVVKLLNYNFNSLAAKIHDLHI